MINIDEIRCLAFESGATALFQTRGFQVNGNPVIQAKIERVECSRESECQFFKKYHRCPTGEEIAAKYHKVR